MDYRELLIKYMAHVIECEGTDFMGSIHPLTKYSMKPKFITNEEWDVLQAISVDMVYKYTEN